MDFGQPNAEIGRKMADGRLLFLALCCDRGLATPNWMATTYKEADLFK